MKRQSKDEQFFMSTEDPEDIQVVRTTGEFVYDHLGKSYIDFNSGWCVGNLGWKRKEIQSKINPAKIPDYIAPGYHYQGWTDLAELLASIASVPPVALTLFCSSPGAMDANNSARSTQP